MQHAPAVSNFDPKGDVMSDHIFQDLSDSERIAIAHSWQTPAGFIQSDSNSRKIVAWLIQHQGFWTHANFDAACIALKTELDWARPAVAPDLRNARAKLMDLGIAPCTARLSQADRAAEDAKSAERLAYFKKHGPPAQMRIRAEAQAQWDREHVCIYRPDGRLDHAATARAREAAVKERIVKE
jgi:hypothetical protein